MSLTIHSVLGNIRSQAAAIAAEIGNVELKSNNMSWGDLKSKDNLARNSNGQVPTLETSEGMITQTNAILVYIAKVATSGSLYGSSDFQTAKVDQWLNFSQFELLSQIKPILLQIWGFHESTAEELKAANEKTEKLLSYLNDSLKTDYLVGSEITIADIANFVVLVYAYRCAFTAEQRAKYSNVTAWFERVASNSAVAKQYGQNRYSSVSWL